MKLKILTLALCAALTLSGCATTSAGQKADLGQQMADACTIADEAVAVSQPFLPLLSAQDQARANVILGGIQTTCSHPPTDAVGVAAAIAGLFVDAAELRALKK